MGLRNEVPYHGARAVMWSGRTGGSALLTAETNKSRRGALAVGCNRGGEKMQGGLIPLLLSEILKVWRWIQSPGV